MNANTVNSLDYSKSEELIRNINIPNSQFQAKWIKNEGYAVGIEGIKLTKNYETLEEALNQIGYGVDVNENEEEILMKVGNIDYELIVRVIKALLIIEALKGEEKNG